ncbi:MAG: hypothetical protein HRU11_06900 [Parvularculaceae bacterium]|nr:hypothetical protein [Parvularculaceae bacterium]
MIVAHSLNSFIQISRHLYEEPYTLNLVIIASNGYAQGALEFYSNTEILEDLSIAFSTFPDHERARHSYQGGSEYPEDNFGWYLRLMAKALNHKEKCLLKLRLNNNARINVDQFMDDPKLTDFSIRTSADSIKRLGEALIEFSKLRHQRLFWTPDDCIVDNNLEYRERRVGDTLEAARLSLPAVRGEEQSGVQPAS